MTGTRGFLAGVATVIASVAMLVTLLAVYANHTLVSSAAFSDRAVRVVHSGDVETLIGSTITDRVVADTGGTAALQPIVDGAVRGAIGSGEFNAEIRAAAIMLHRELMSGTANSLTLTLPDAGSAIAASVGSQNPELAAALRNAGSITVIDVRIPSTEARVMHHLTLAAKEAWLFLVITIGLILLALTVSPNRVRTLRGLGFGAMVAGLLVAAGYLIGRGVAVDKFSDPNAQTVAHAAWSIYLGSLVTWGLILAGVGLAITLLASALRTRESVY